MQWTEEGSRQSPSLMASSISDSRAHDSYPSGAPAEIEIKCMRSVPRKLCNVRFSSLVHLLQFQISHNHSNRPVGRKHILALSSRSLVTWTRGTLSEAVAARCSARA